MHVIISEACSCSDVFLLKIQDDESDANEEFRDIVLSKILTSMDASLVAMYVMTAKEMPKEVFIEEVIDKVVQMIKTQLRGTIFPEFDPVYRISPNSTSEQLLLFPCKTSNFMKNV